MAAIQISRLAFPAIISGMASVIIFLGLFFLANQFGFVGVEPGKFQGIGLIIIFVLFTGILLSVLRNFIKL